MAEAEPLYLHQLRIMCDEIYDLRSRVRNIESRITEMDVRAGADAGARKRYEENFAEIRATLDRLKRIKAFEDGA